MSPADEFLAAAAVIRSIPSCPHVDGDDCDCLFWEAVADSFDAAADSPQVDEVLLAEARKLNRVAVVLL